MTLDQLILKLSELRNTTSGGSEVFIFHPEEGCLKPENLELCECDDDIPDFISIKV